MAGKNNYFQTPRLNDIHIPLAAFFLILERSHTLITLQDYPERKDTG